MRLLAAVACAALASAGYGTPASGQMLDDLCAVQADVAECRLAVESVRMLQPRMAMGLWGGNDVPGTASTLGMRIGTLPRLSIGARVNVVPAEMPSLIDRTAGAADRATLIGLSTDVTVGILSGFSPLPTVGGVFSLDLVARASYLALPVSEGFHDDAIWGGSVGARLGLLRESFTLPGVSLTGSYRWTRETGFGDPVTGTTDGFFDGSIRNYDLTAAVSKRVALLRLTGGLALDRYVSDVSAGYTPPAGTVQIPVAGTVETDRWNAWVNAGLTVLIFHASLELGLQEAPVPDGLPQTVDVDPIGWYGGLAFRISL